MAEQILKIDNVYVPMTEFCDKLEKRAKERADQKQAEQKKEE